MQVDVLVPEDYMGDVIGGLNARRGQIQGMEPRGGVEAISAAVPLSEMFGYATALRSSTQGRGSTPCSPATTLRSRSPYRIKLSTHAIKATTNS